MAVLVSVETPSFVIASDSEATQAKPLPQSLVRIASLCSQ